MANEDISKLPKWAQSRLRNAESELASVRGEINRIREEKREGDPRLWVYSPSETRIGHTPAFPLDLFAGIMRPTDERPLLRVHPAIKSDVGLGKTVDGIRVNADDRLIVAPEASNQVFITTAAWDWKIRC